MSELIDKAAYAASGAFGYEPVLVDDPATIRSLGPSELSGDDWRNVVRTVLQAIREPSEAMLRAGWTSDLPYTPSIKVDVVWQAMIDAALAE